MAAPEGGGGRRLATGKARRADGGTEGRSEAEHPERSDGVAAGRGGPSRERRPTRLTGKGHRQRRRAQARRPSGLGPSGSGHAPCDRHPLGPRHVRGSGPQSGVERGRAVALRHKYAPSPRDGWRGGVRAQSRAPAAAPPPGPNERATRAKSKTREPWRRAASARARSIHPRSKGRSRARRSLPLLFLDLQLAADATPFEQQPDLAQPHRLRESGEVDREARAILCRDQSDARTNRVSDAERP